MGLDVSLIELIDIPKKEISEKELDQYLEKDYDMFFIKDLKGKEDTFIEKYKDLIISVSDMRYYDWKTMFKLKNLEYKYYYITQEEYNETEHIITFELDTSEVPQHILSNIQLPKKVVFVGKGETEDNLIFKYVKTDIFLYKEIQYIARRSAWEESCLWHILSPVGYKEYTQYKTLQVDWEYSLIQFFIYTNDKLNALKQFLKKYNENKEFDNIKELKENQVLFFSY